MNRWIGKSNTIKVWVLPQMLKEDSIFPISTNMRYRLFLKERKRNNISIWHLVRKMRMHVRNGYNNSIAKIT
jgi:hypothetical protein